ncbi:hypothetical protein C8R48DRAFT_680023 [Suillus tomentosus]|nr:hypothetical protein C8R48DRAFT_680023 [Suillus tomentosus]
MTHEMCKAIRMLARDSSLQYILNGDPERFRLQGERPVSVFMWGKHMYRGTKKVLARRATLDATFAHDEDNSSRTCTLMQDISSTVNHIGGIVHLQESKIAGNPRGHSGAIVRFLYVNYIATTTSISATVLPLDLDNHMQEEEAAAQTV